MLLTYSVLQPRLLKMPKMAQTADNWETGCAMAQMRIKDIAAEAGVSPATVSRYLNM
ncbi:MAG: LacI family DNA-binding transcriptional regulator, partial [Collinsella sp.]